MATAKHPLEMPDDVLTALGFERKQNPYSDDEAWTHKRGSGKFYFHILTPDQVAIALIEIGHSEFRRRACDAISSIDMEQTN